MIFYVLHAGMTPPDKKRRTTTRKAKQNRVTTGHTGRAGDKKAPAKAQQKKKAARSIRQATHYRGKAAGSAATEQHRPTQPGAQ